MDKYDLIALDIGEMPESYKHTNTTAKRLILTGSKDEISEILWYFNKKIYWKED